MGSAVTRRVLEVKPGGPWLVLADGAWAVDTGHETAVPFVRSRMWLLPLVQRSRNDVEREAHALLGPDDPDLGEALRAMIDMGLNAWSDFWIANTLTWMTADEIALFSDRVHEIARGHAGSQSTQHAAKRLLKHHGHWSPKNAVAAVLPPPPSPRPDDSRTGHP
ncbi:hypothetical protein [Actinomadura sp. 6N118]|uniref:hypothetical protein n=1 Tax=Actinomadura sp. 6N118 TaxID=3375151 RepID=UPI0037BDE6F6